MLGFVEIHLDSSCFPFSFFGHQGVCLPLWNSICIHLVFSSVSLVTKGKLGFVEFCDLSSGNCIGETHNQLVTGGFKCSDVNFFACNKMKEKTSLTVKDL
jgi:hypothetical protein